MRLLGPVTVLSAGRKLPLGPRSRQQLVLARLALTPGTPVTLTDLIDTLWPEDTDPGPPPTAVGQVHKYICRLRKILDPCRPAQCCRPVLIRTGSCYLLDLHPSQVDTEIFREHLAQARRHQQAGDLTATADSLQAALALWHGEPLAGLPGSRAQSWRDSLNQDWLEATTKHIGVQLELGHHAALIGRLTELTATYPLHEPLWAQRMLALYRSGRQDDALFVYRTIDRKLRDQGIQPSHELQRLHEHLLNQDPGLTS